MRNFLKFFAAPVAAALLSGIIVAWGAQTNYLGTVFIADSTVPTRQLTVNSDGSINAAITSGGGGSVTQGTSPWIVAGGGTAGSAATGVVTIQGISSMTPILANPGTAANWGLGATAAAVPATAQYIGINTGGNLVGWTGAVSVASGGVASGAFASGSIASGAIAAGAQVDLLTMRGTKAAGTAATNSMLTGGVYNTSYPTLTNGQQAAMQFDAMGGLAMVGQRPLVFKGSINNSQSLYASANTDVGGLITVSTGLPSGTILTNVVLRVKILSSDVTALSAMYFPMFDANPTGSTITENTALAIVTADLSKTVLSIASASVATPTTGGVYSYTTTGPRMAVDASGNIYFAMVTGGTTTSVSGSNKFVYELDVLF